MRTAVCLLVIGALSGCAAPAGHHLATTPAEPPLSPVDSIPPPSAVAGPREGVVPAPKPARPTAAEVECTRDAPALLAAVEGNRAEEVRSLLDHGANPNACRDLGEGSSVTSLEQAMNMKSVTIARLLIDAGADPNLAPQNTAPPLEQAMEIGDEDLAARLIAAGADVNMKVGVHGVPLILTAARPDRIGIVRRMLAAGADPNVRFYDRTPLGEAVASGSTPLIAALLEGGARPTPEVQLPPGYGKQSR